MGGSAWDGRAVARCPDGERVLQILGLKTTLVCDEITTFRVRLTNQGSSPVASLCLVTSA